MVSVLSLAPYRKPKVFLADDLQTSERLILQRPDEFLHYSLPGGSVSHEVGHRIPALLPRSESMVRIVGGLPVFCFNTRVARAAE
jgi:hypothetical protein